RPYRLAATLPDADPTAVAPSSAWQGVGLSAGTIAAFFPTERPSKNRAASIGDDSIAPRCHHVDEGRSREFGGPARVAANCRPMDFGARKRVRRDAWQLF
ncbi:MAG: hypothetical protein VX973_12045, partial [Pseudomonadota bacterium]|nr:hypothetical protein [Pseudomonadota bacterium]